MTTQMKRMDIVANNIANANTTSFKRDRISIRSFTEELASRLNDKADKTTYNNINVGGMSMGVFIDDVYSDFEGGGLEQTNGPLDLAIIGTGFFCVSNSNRAGESTELYSRDGSLTLGNDGLLMTKEGNPVLGQHGMIHIPAGTVMIGVNGDITSNGTYIDKIRMTDFADKHELRKTENNLYQATNRAIKSGFTGQVQQGFLEGSNVNAMREMIDMISLNRLYDANARMITTHDTMMSHAANDVGRKV
jgi:flagellar basal-body rod protein FlgG